MGVIDTHVLWNRFVQICNINIYINSGAQTLFSLLRVGIVMGKNKKN